MRRSTTPAADFPEPVKRFRAALTARKEQTGMSYRDIADELQRLTGTNTPTASTVHRWTSGAEFSIFGEDQIAAISAWVSKHPNYRAWTPAAVKSLREEILDVLLQVRVPRGELKSRLRRLETSDHDRDRELAALRAAEREREAEMAVIRADYARMMVELGALRTAQRV